MRVADIGIANRLDRPVNTAYDHVLGPDNAEITLVEYGSYDCPHCRAANERISEVRDQFGDRAAVRVSASPDHGQRALPPRRRARRAGARPTEFWDAHVALMTRSPTLSEDDLAAVSARPGSRPRESPDRGRGSSAPRPRARRGGRRRVRGPAACATRRRSSSTAPLRWSVGRELVLRCDARLARPSRARRRARISPAGRRRPACCC